MSHRIPTCLRPLALAALLAAPSLALPATGNGWCHLTPFTAETPAMLEFYGWEVELGDHWAFALNRGDDTVDAYRRDGGSWSRVQTLASPSGGFDQFGASIALHGQDLYIGAPQSDLMGDSAGAVFRFTETDGTWTYTQTIVSPWADPFDRFGTAIDVDDGWLAVGVYGGDPTGAIDVLHDDGGTWVAHARLQHPDAVKIGHTVAIHGTDDGFFANVFVADPNAYGHTGAAFHARVHPFGYQWGPSVQAPVPESNDAFAFDLDFDGEHLVIGSAWEEQLGLTTGAAYVYDVDGSVFPPNIVLAESLLPEASQVGSEFGKHVAVDGGRIAIAAPQSFANEVSQPGAVYVYRPTQLGNGWELEDRLVREGGQHGDLLGGALAIAGTQVLAGAWNAGGNGTGELVLFSLTSQQMAGGLAPVDVLATAETYGEGKPGALGVPVITLEQLPVPGETSHVVLSQVPNGSSPVLLVSLSPAAIPFDLGTLLVGDPMVIIALPPVVALNQLDLSWTVPDDLVLAGVEVFAQAMVIDPAGFGPKQTAQSRGLKLIIGY